MKRTFVVILGLVARALCAALAVVWWSPAAQQGVFDRAARQLSVPADTSFLAGDAVRVVIVGSSAPLPSARRAKASVAVFVGGKFYLVDVGPESVENLLLWNLPRAAVGGVLLTQFHSDHIGDLGEFNLQTSGAGAAVAACRVRGARSRSSRRGLQPRVPVGPGLSHGPPHRAAQAAGDVADGGASGRAGR